MMKPDEICPMGGEHDTSRPILGIESNAALGFYRGDVVGYSCNKCHKTWDCDWIATYDKLDAQADQ